MELRKILNGIENLKAKGNLDVEISSVECNSKEVKQGSLYIAIKGYDNDGHDFVEDAISNGAKAVMMRILVK